MNGIDEPSGRQLQIAERLGEFGARLDTLERRVETELHSMNDTLSKVMEAQADLGRRVEGALTQARQANNQPNPDMLLAVQGLNRAVDGLAKVAERPPPSSPITDLVNSAASAGGARRGGGNALTWVGWVMAAATSAWMLRGAASALLGV